MCNLGKVLKFLFASVRLIIAHTTKAVFRSTKEDMESVKNRAGHIVSIISQENTSWCNLNKSSFNLEFYKTCVV